MAPETAYVIPRNICVPPDRIPMAAATANNTAQWLLTHANEQGVYFSNLKLQKLLYYAQGWHLAIYDEPLFKDEIEAWPKGPVLAGVYQTYKRYGDIPISDTPLISPELPVYLENHLREIIEVFGYEPAERLVAMTHAESPWQIARGNLPPDARSRNVVSMESMKQYFKSVASKSGPTGETKEAIDELERGDGVSFGSVEDLFSDLNA